MEWFEKGETKGKEVEIDAIIALNPEVLICRNQDKKPSALIQEPSNIITAQNKLTRVSIIIMQTFNYIYIYI